MYKMTARVYGTEGHRQKESLKNSYFFKDWNGIGFFVKNSDITGTNEYSEIEVYAPDRKTAKEALQGQISDGVWENCRVGRVVIL